MSKPIRWLTRSATLASLGVVGGALAVTARHLLATPQPLESRLFGENQIAGRPEGDIFYNVAGPATAEPVVLLHDFYPGASSDEFRRLYPRLAPDYRVYAPDWLGFGLSERPALAYTGEFYASSLIGFLRETVGRPATVLASGLAGNIAVRAASDAPELFARLVLVEPRPLADTLPGPNMTQTAVRALQRASLGLVPYALLSTRAALRWQIRRHAAHPGEGAATDDVLDHVYASAHQFGGHHALLALLTGELDLPIENALPSLEPPVLIVGGAGDGSRSLAALRDMTLLDPQARLLAVPDAGPAVHEDQPAALMEQLSTWLRMPPTRSTPRISETRATARTFAGAIRVDRDVTPGPGGGKAPAGPSMSSATSHAPVAAVHLPATPDAPADDTPAAHVAAAQPASAPAQDATPGARPAATAEASADAASATNVAPNSDTPSAAEPEQTPEAAAGIGHVEVAPDAPLREQFDEPHGVISPTPGLEGLAGLAGLAEHVPESGEIEDGYDLIPEARPLPGDDDTPHVVGKAAAAIKETTAPADLSARDVSTQPERAAIRRKGRTAPSVTPTTAQPSEPVSPALRGNQEDQAPEATQRGGANGQREWPVPGGRKHGSHRHKHGHH